MTTAQAYQFAVGGVVSHPETPEFPETFPCACLKNEPSRNQSLAERINIRYFTTYFHANRTHNPDFITAMGTLADEVLIWLFGVIW